MGRKCAKTTENLRTSKKPIEEMLTQATIYPQPFSAAWDEESVTLRIGESLLQIERYNSIPHDDEGDEMPDDIADDVAG